MKIRVITVGTIKDPAYRSLEQDFLKQLRKYARVEKIEVKAESVEDSRSEHARQEEGKRILRHMEDTGILIALDEHGDSFTSHSFAEFLQKQKDLGEHLTFVIGGPFGLSRDVLAKADLRMSLSSMTLLHDMTYVILLEQLYRGFSINAGSGYQK